MQLKDIAKVQVSKPEDTLTRVNGEDGLALVVSKDSTSNAVTINKQVIEATKKVNKKYTNANASVLVSTADMVQTSVHSMVNEVLLGALFATIVIMLFLRNIRTTFITIVSIPLSLCLTLFLLSRSGVTLNILTLGGVAVAVGRLVDDSIVVIENIFNKMQKGTFSVQLSNRCYQRSWFGHHCFHSYNSSRIFAHWIGKWRASRVYASIRVDDHVFTACLLAGCVDRCPFNECGVVKNSKASKA